MGKQIKKFLSNHKFFIICICAIILCRYLLINLIPLMVVADSPHDHLWFARATQSFLDGEWLGEYNQLTLIKGMAGPAFLALARWIGLSYMDMMTITYIISCLFFVYAIKPLLKCDAYMLIAFVILMFNPISFSSLFQVLYRNGYAQWQVLFVFGGIFALYLRRKNKVISQVPWAITTGLALWLFCNTREDSAWIYPFVFVSVFVLVIYIVMDRVKNDKSKSSTKDFLLKILVSVLPVIILIQGNFIVMYINNYNYGAYLLNDRTHGYFSEFIKDLYAIKVSDETVELYTDFTQPYAKYQYNIYHQAIYKAYEASPTLAAESQYIESAIHAWDNSETIRDGELEYDHMIFAIRDGVAAAGYYTSLKDSENFYAKVHKELQAAFDNGFLDKNSSLIYTNIAPLRHKEDYLKIVKAIPDMLTYIIGFSDVSTNILPASGTENNIQLFLDVSGDGTVFMDKPYVRVSGWTFADDKYGNMDIYIHNSDSTIMQMLQLNKSDDVYKYFLSQGYENQNAMKSRFNAKIEGVNSISELFLSFYSNDNQLVASFNLSKLTEYGADFKFCIDNVYESDTLIQGEKLYKPYVERCNVITSVYKHINPVLFTFSIISYFFSLFYCIYFKFNKRTLPVKIFEGTLLQSSILLSLLALVLAMSYVSIAAFGTKTYGYLAPGYILVLMFIVISISTFMEICFDYYKVHNNNL